MSRLGGNYYSGRFVCMRIRIGIRPITLFLILLFCLTGVCFCADADGSEASESAADRQLRINKNVLLEGPNQETRDDAAMELLLSEDSASRQVLIECLKQKDNQPAVRAICTGLVDSLTDNQPVTNKGDFLEPLVELLKSAKGKDAELVADAMLIFEFSDVAETLREIAASEDSPKQARLNAIHAIGQRPADKEAIGQLVGLLDQADKDIAEAAANALPYWIPKGMDPKEILNDLKRKSQGEIIRDRMVYLEEQVRRVSAERDQWQRLYVGSLDRAYESSDESAKGVLIFENIEKSKSGALKVWALNKIQSQTGSVNWPEGFSGRLVGLISDSANNVRLLTANVLTKMSNLSPPEKLLEQLRKETDQDVRLAVFEALGESCYYSLLSSAPENAVSDEIRNATLTEADEYLESEDAVKSKMGAVVIRKLIEPNGMDKEVVSSHLEKILGRYNSSSDELKADLLNVMAKIAGQNANRSAAGVLYKQAFVDGLEGEGGNLLKQAAVIGLINIDKAAAIELFVEVGLYDDGNPAVVSMVVQLAGEVGKADDLEWLAGKLDGNGAGEAAWQSMRQILLRQSAEVIVGWAEKLIHSKTNPERIRELIEIAEQKAVGTANNQVVMEKLHNELVPGLLEVYLQAADTVRVTQVVTKRLAIMRPEDKVLAVIDGYLNSSATRPEDKKALLDALAGIKDQVPEESNQLWHDTLDGWVQKHSNTAEAEPVQETPQ